MSVRGNDFFVYGLAVMLSCIATLAAAEELNDNSAEAAYTPWDTSLYELTPKLDEQTIDDAVEPVQLLAPQAPRATQMAQRPRRSAVARRNRNLASVPFMIGDTTAANCVTYGGVSFVALGHPTLGCSRVNIAEANSPLPTDRIYASYRHFQNATRSRIISTQEAFDLDRFTLGGERTYFDGMMSTEIRMPLEFRLSSDIGTYVVDSVPPASTFPRGFDPITNDREMELANISLIFKALLTEREHFALTAGLGVTLPTAQDVTYNATVDTIVDDFGLNALNVAQISSIAANETIYLAPFLSWIYKPTERFFHQGFLQVEVAANPSQVHTNAAGFFTFDTNGDDFFDFTDPTDTTLAYATPPLPIVGTGSGTVSQDLHPQVLLRLNLGFGYTLHENDQADWIQKLTGIFEVHYTGTISEANISRSPLNVAINGITIPPGSPILMDPAFAGINNIGVGNFSDQIHIVNLTAGLSANMGNLVVTHGVSAPVTDSENRGFDFEYNLQVQRPF